MGRFQQVPRLMKEFDDKVTSRSKIHLIRWHDRYPAATELERNPRKTDRRSAGGG